MDRGKMRVSRCGLWALTFMPILALLLNNAGCAGPLATLMYVIKGNNIPALYKDLKEKTVAVVCESPSSQSWQNQFVAEKVAGKVTTLLRENVKKIKMIDARKVNDWIDENGPADPVEVGRALKADVVVAIDIESFQLLEGQTLFRGRANVLVHVFDVKTGDTLWDHTPSEIVYPPTVGVPVQDNQEHQFRATFVSELAQEIAQYFYDHDKYANFASDSKVLGTFGN